jgi:hypothetical protein
LGSLHCEHVEIVGGLAFLWVRLLRPLVLELFFLGTAISPPIGAFVSLFDSAGIPSGTPAVTTDERDVSHANGAKSRSNSEAPYEP